MIEFHQFHIPPVDDIERQNVCAGVPAVPVLMARAISLISSWQSWRSGVATAIATMSSTRADRDSGVISSQSRQGLDLCPPRRAADGPLSRRPAALRRFPNL